MAEADSTRRFDLRLYVERSFDEQVIDAIRGWAAKSDRLCWISLSTARGHGNSWLLENLAEKLSRGSGSNLLLQPVIVRAAEEGGTPPPFSPLQDVLTARRRQRLQWLRRLWSLPHDMFTHPLQYLMKMLLVFVIGTIGVSVQQYLNEARHSFREFGPYFRIHWEQAVGILLISIVVSVAWQFLNRKEDDGDELSEAEKRRYLTMDSLAAGLAQLASNRAGVALLVDRAHLLPTSDRSLLLDLQKRAPESGAIARLREQYRFVIVTVDELPTFAAVDPGRRGAAPRVDAITTLSVPDEFTRNELLEIAEKQRPQLYERLKDETDDAARDILDSAGANIHALMDDVKGLSDKAAEYFLKAEGGNPDTDSFGPESLLLYQAVRIIGGAGKARCDNKEVVDWLRALLRGGHLKRFKISAAASEKELLKDLRELGVARVWGAVLSFDATLCRAIAEFARAERKPLAARAYYYWLRESLLSASVDVATLAATMPSQTKRHALKRSAWFAMEIGEFAEVADLTDKLPREGRREICLDAVRALVGASIVYAREGDTQLAAATIEDLDDWYESDLVDVDPALADAMVTHAWELYWLSADGAVAQMLGRLAERAPKLKERQPWRIEARFHDVVMGRAAEPWKRSAKRELPAALTNRAALAETWRAARGGQRGFVFAFDYPDRPAAEADIPQFPSGAATALRALSAAAATTREDADEIIARWQETLREQVDSGCVGDEVLLVYERAALAHARMRVAIGGADAAAINEHADDAARAYDRALLLSSLAGWRGLYAELSFHFGRLLYELSLVHRDDNWDTWEAAFGNAITTERGAEWLLFTPEVHFIRWQFFRKQAVERCLEDAWGVYETARPTITVDVFLGLYRSLLADFANGSSHASERDRALARCTQLFVEWGDVLAPLPEAQPYWQRKQLEAEQAEALGYAAQARRIADDHAAAAALLDRAEALLNALDQADPERRQIMLHLRFQRTLLVQSDSPKHVAAVRAFWSEIQFEDHLFPLALSLIVQVETKDETIADPWPVDDTGALASDADAPAVSLDPAWLATRGIEVIRNRFEYRLRQYEFGFTVSKTLVDFTRLTSALVEAGLDFQLIDPVRNDVIDIVTKSVILTRMQRLESEEVDLLRLLRIVTDSDPMVHAQYVDAIVRYEKLFEREQRLLSEGLLGWYALAERLHHYFNMLVNDDLANEEYIAQLRAHGYDPSAAFAEQERRRKQYAEARTAFDAGNVTDCIAILDHALPPATAPWVFFEDLGALQLWFEATSRVSQAPHLADRAPQLRAFTMRYVRQVSITVEDTQIRLVAMKLLKFLEEGMRAASRLPIAGEEESEAPPLPEQRSRASLSL